MAIASILQPVYEKKKKLEEEVGKLAVSRDTSKREAEEAAEAVTDLNTRKGALEALVESIIDTAKAAIEMLTGIVTQGADAINTANSAIDTAHAVLTGLSVKIKAEETVLEGILASQKARMEDIARENEKLGARERDLRIYARRLQEKYDELGLGEIVLSDPK